MQTELLGYHYSQFTFSRILADKARRNGDKTFLHFLPDGRKYSYIDIDVLSNRIANRLLANGIGTGAHVAMLMENSPEQLLVYFALGKIGAVVVPINIAARGQFLEYYLRQSDSTALVIDQSMLEHFLALGEDTAIRQVYVVGDAGAAAAGSRVGRWEDFEQLYDGGTDAPAVDVSYKDPCAIMYTSGTTGASKGNVFNQINTLSFGVGMVEPLKYCADDIYHVCMPLFHTGAYGGAVLTMLMVDGGVALTRRLSVSRFWDEVRRSGATAAQLLSVSGFLLNQAESPLDCDHRLRLAIATPVPPHVVEFEKRFGVRLVQGYGLSDFALGFSQLIDGPVEKRKSIGLPLEGVQARIVDEDDVEVPAGQIGEIVLRKDGLPFATAQGYYKMPEASLAARTNLWFHTGDRGWMDEDGYFYFSDRKKDAIRRRGENISAFEVEQAIAKLDAVADVAVYPISTAGGEDDVAATIVLKQGVLITEVDVIEHCCTQMPYFMVPRYIDFRPEMPRTMTQKIIKYELRKHVEENPMRVWDRERVGIKVRRN